MEASALTTASHGSLLARRSPLLRLQSDEKLVALIRDGHDRAFEVLFDRYQARLLAFCRHLLNSVQDAEDVLQEVFVAAHTAMIADSRPINARPWLYRIARNRCLNHLRRPVAEGQDSMDVHPHENGTTTLEQVQTREQLREIVSDMRELPETQRTAMVLREIDDLSYTEIAQAMGTSLPAVKSLLVRGRMSLAEASEARVLTCGDVRLELAEAAEGISKASGPARRHVRDCKACRRYRRQLRSSTKAVAGLAPFGLFVLVRKLFAFKVGGAATGGGAAGTAGTAGGGAAGAGGVAGAGGAAGAAGAGGAAGAAGTAAGAVGTAGAAGGTAAAAGGSSAIGAIAAGGAAGGLGAKAAVGVATAALFTAGAVGVKNMENTTRHGPASTVSALGTNSVETHTTHVTSASGHGAAAHARDTAKLHATRSETATKPDTPAKPTATEPTEPTTPATGADSTPTGTAGKGTPPPAPATNYGGQSGTGNASGSSDGTGTNNPAPPDPPPPTDPPTTPTDPTPPPTDPPTTPTDPAPPAHPAPAPAPSGS